MGVNDFTKGRKGTKETTEVLGATQPSVTSLLEESVVTTLHQKKVYIVVRPNTQNSEGLDPKMGDVAYLLLGMSIILI